MHKIVLVIFVAFFSPELFAIQSSGNYIFCCNESNDLFQTAIQNNLEVTRYDSPVEAIEKAPEGAGVFVLADDYPYRAIHVESSVFEKAKAKSLKLYIEFPEFVPELSVGETLRGDKERLVVSQKLNGTALEKGQMLELHDCHYKPIRNSNPAIVLAKVAGYDHAVFGITDVPVHPILFTHPERDILIATSKLSNFIKGRYAPKERWAEVWKFVFSWMNGSSCHVDLKWDEAVRPTLDAHSEVGKKQRLESFLKGVDWFYKSNLLVPFESAEQGSIGSAGIYECYLSEIEHDGNQSVSWRVRADCTSESAMAIAMRAFVNQDYNDLRVAENMQSFVYRESMLAGAERADSLNPNYGYIGWSTHPNNLDNYYGDDNARTVLGTIVCSSALGVNKWDRNVVQTILANFRTTSMATGFKPRRLRGATLEKLGCEFYSDQEYYHYAPHFQSWIWACYLWLYDKTGYVPLLKVAKTGIQNMMEQYPHNWEWANGLQQERARMLLPLAWLNRIEGTREQRQWLDTIISDLLTFQDESGAIREELGTVGKGMYSPPTSNAEFGIGEAPLIQQNGEPVADLLYTCNFALVGLNEAISLTGDDPRISDALNRLIDFLVRIQVTSTDHSELDGAWFRAFDFKRWQYWASSADHGWGVWTTETGWTQAWITSTIMLNELQTTIWDFTRQSKVKESFAEIKDKMLK